MPNFQSYDIFQLTEDAMWKFVNVNCAAALQMSRIVLPGMISRSRGAIVNISSAASLGPLPVQCVYSATKIFEDYFGLGLGFEIKDTGVVVQTVNPCVVLTKINQEFKSFKGRKPNLFMPGPKKYAKHALSTLGFAEQTSGDWPHGLQATILGKNNSTIFLLTPKF